LSLALYSQILEFKEQYDRGHVERQWPAEYSED
jgi:hypothetical protein